MKKISAFLTAFLLCVNVAICQTPVISMTTTKEIGSAFSFELRASDDNTPVQVDFGNGTLVNYIIGTAYTEINANLINSKIVKIHGAGITEIFCSNDSLIALNVTEAIALTILSCNNNQLTTLNVANNTALTSLNCSNNLISTLDLSKNTALIELSCFNNQLSSLDITNGAALLNLNCLDNQIKTLDLSTNTALKSLNCNNNQLSTLNLSKNTALTFLDCNNNQLTILDVTKNTALMTLWCYTNQLSTLDITNNTVLTSFYCYNNQLTNIDLSKNIALTNIECGNNRLSTLDLTNNTALINMLCYLNQLTTLILPNTTTLDRIGFNYNNLTFASIPLKKPTWSLYDYAPQYPILIKKSIEIGNELDLSSQYNINGYYSNYTWKKSSSGDALIENTDYTITNGKTIFLKTQTDSIFCEMTNNTFPDLSGNNSLRTTNIFVSLVSHINKLNNSELKLYTANKTLYISISNNAKLYVYDINDRLVISKPIFEGINSVQIPKTGVYMIKIDGNKATIAQKVFIE